MNEVKKYRGVKVPELAIAIAKSIVDRDFVQRLPDGLYAKDDKGKILLDEHGNREYSDQALSQIFHLFIFYSGMVKDYTEEVKISTEAIEKEEETKDILSKIKSLFKTLID